jgi:hypothetical protein
LEDLDPAFGVIAHGPEEGKERRQWLSRSVEVLLLAIKNSHKSATLLADELEAGGGATNEILGRRRSVLALLSAVLVLALDVIGRKRTLPCEKLGSIGRLALLGLSLVYL